MPTIVHFDVACDNPERAKKFYEGLFDWKIELQKGMPYYFIQTTDKDGTEGVAGGMGQRGAPEQRITNFIGVDSVDEYLEKVKQLGGQVLQPKMAVPGWGYLANCVDTEGNSFGLWEDNKDAK